MVHVRERRKEEISLLPKGGCGIVDGRFFFAAIGSNACYVVAISFSFGVFL